MAGIWREKGVIPYVIALFLNALTDLGHKIIIQNTVFKIYDDQEQIIYTAILNALILLPFIALFTPSGYLSHRFSKVRVMRYGALGAVVITLLITASYYQGWFWGAFALTLVLAAQSALYSPAKYGYIKELAGEKKISALNAIVQSFTTVAILSGIIVYTVLFENALTSPYASEADILYQIAPLGWLLVGGSIVECLLLLRVKEVAASSDVTFDFHKYLTGRYFGKNWLLLRRKREIFEAILFLSLFWSISQVILASFGAYAKSTLGIQNTIVVQGLMALAAVGIIIGSVIATRISRHYLHKGLIVLGAMILTVTLMILPNTHDLRMIGATFFGFGIGGAMLIVALNALIQSDTPSAHLPFVLAGNNWVQNVCMVAALLLTTLSAYFGFEALWIFYGMLGVSLLLSIGTVIRYKDYFIWLLFEWLLALRYNIIPLHPHNVPRTGAVLMLGNHISWIDWILVQVGVERRIRYLMERSIYEKPFIRPVMKIGEVIPISSTGAKEAFKHARIRLQNRDIIALFPEGSISHDGEIGKIYPGYRVIAAHQEGVIVPFYIDGIYGSVFSRSAHRHSPSRSWFRRNVRVIYGDPISIQSDPETVYNAIMTLKERYGTQ
ncbi:MAG: MFS transporter [Sulfuricurvum sp.]|jgi:acyl-[acyl-carrier-protein]-phospholipid O-acyltransferase/long-chain-fatty-acid--[acyl-carrier-protein] ligase|uniref:MFS transporter n=1 Tax=Sulfuricurvum sp. TaxID=2025608 RepID=UPI0025FB892F|nr:MFS transporter [Sulfuricurvum sp.]MCK9372951.1 MFS transporter [Sulfuricurvum sp.]